MNFVFISPNFPETYWAWCDRLKQRGVNVLGVGDSPYDALKPELKAALTEYYKVDSLEDYDQVFRAVAFLSFKHGKIDWIESNNEYWLSTDARLRDDFNVKTGVGAQTIARWQSKAEMKPLYAAAGVPSARQIRATGIEEAREFVKEVGWPLFAKPERGMGSGGAGKVENDEELQALFANGMDEPYVLEDYIQGDTVSWDAILDSQGNVLFENQEGFPPSMAELVKNKHDMCYMSLPGVDPKLAAAGRATAKAFGITSRFVHMEFFRLWEDKPGLGDAGDYVGLEVNVRPPGGSTPDIMNYTHSTDVYSIWADMVVSDTSYVPDSGKHAYGVYVGRRDIHNYVHSHEEIFERYGDRIVMCDRIPAALADDMGDMSYVALLNSPEELTEYREFVMAQV